MSTADIVEQTEPETSPPEESSGASGKEAEEPDLITDLVLTQSTYIQQHLTLLPLKAFQGFLMQSHLHMEVK